MGANTNIHVDLSQAVEDGICNGYEEYCNNLKTELGKMKDDLEGVCNNTHYEPMVKMVQDTINLFEGNIRDAAQNAFKVWTEGDGTFEKAAQNSQVGGEGEATARNIDGKIATLFEEFWNPNPMGVLEKIDTDRPEVSENSFDELHGIYTKYQGNINGIGDDAVRMMKQLGSDTPTYNIVIPAIVALYKPMEKAFETIGSKIESAKSESAGFKKTQEQRNQDAESDTATAATEEDIANALKMYDDV